MAGELNPETGEVVVDPSQHHEVLAAGAHFSPVDATLTMSTQELVDCHTRLSSEVAMVRQAIQTEADVPEVELDAGSWELKQLWGCRAALFISPEGLLKLRLPRAGWELEVVVCPRNLRGKVIWDVTVGRTLE